MRCTTGANLAALLALTFGCNRDEEVFNLYVATFVIALFFESLVSTQFSAVSRAAVLQQSRRRHQQQLVVITLRLVATFAHCASSPSCIRPLVYLPINYTRPPCDCSAANWLSVIRSLVAASSLFVVMRRCSLSSPVRPTHHHRQCPINKCYNHRA